MTKLFVRGAVAIWLQDSTGQESMLVFEDVDASVSADLSTYDPHAWESPFFGIAQDGRLRLDGTFKSARWVQRDVPARPTSPAGALPPAQERLGP